MTFLWLAVGILLAHNIIPHHHHYGLEGFHQACTMEDKESHSCSHEEKGILSFHHETGEKEHCDGCQFRTDIPDQKIKKSFHQLFLISNDEFTLTEKQANNYHIAFYYILYSPQYLKLQSDRAPPANARSTTT